MDNIKKSWSEITISDYNKIKNATTDEEILSVLSNKPINQLNAKELIHIQEHLSFLLEPPKYVYKDKIKLNGVKYRVTLNPSDITAGQFIDLQSAVEMEDSLAIAIIPEDKEYALGYSINELKDTIYNHMKMDDVLSFFFFYNSLYEILERSLMESLVPQQVEKMKTKTAKDLKNSIKSGAEYILQRKLRLLKINQ